MQIDPTARIDDGAQIAERTIIGPYCIIGPEVVIGEGCRLIANVHVTGRTTIGDRTIVHPFACLGGPPQTLTLENAPTTLIIGSGCTIREHVTMNRGTRQGGGETVVGDGGYFMANSHVAHDCRVGRQVVFANGATLAGHCTIGDYVVMSGNVAVHQFTHIGSGAMVSGVSGVAGDIIPFGLAAGIRARLIGINVVGMRRRQYPPDVIRRVRTAYRRLFVARGTLAERVEATQAEFGQCDAVAEILAFMRAPRPRSLCQPRSRGLAGRDETRATS